MPCSRAALACLLALPMLPAAAVLAAEEIPVDALLAEANAMAGQARKAYAAAHDLPPSLTRNAALSKVREAIKPALDKYALAADVAPSRSQEISAAVSDLKGMLFWCNKSIIVFVPETPGPLPDAAPAAPAPPAPAAASKPPPAPLAEAEGKELYRCLSEMKEAYGRIEDCRDHIARRRTYLRDIYALLDGSRQDWEKRDLLHHGGVTWNAIKAYEARREALMEEGRKSQKKVQEKLKDIRRNEEQARGYRALLESYQERALPFMADWSLQKGGEGLPEDLVAYINGQFKAPRFSFTPVPADAPFPAEADADKAKSLEARQLLDRLLTLTAREVALAQEIAEGEVEAARMQSELNEIDKHWKWRVAYSAWSSDVIKQMRRSQEALRKGLEKSAAAKARDDAERAGIRKQLADLLPRLEMTEPAQARVVEGWRRRQKALPVALEEALEAWTRKALGGK